MKKLIWIAQTFIIIFFFAFGFPKIVSPIKDLIDFGMIWMEDFSVIQIRTIGILETAGFLGLSLHYLIKAIPRIIIPLSALGLALTMFGAIITHLMRQDPAVSIILTAFVMILCLFVADNRYKELR